MSASLVARRDLMHHIDFERLFTPRDARHRIIIYRRRHAPMAIMMPVMQASQLT